MFICISQSNISSLWNLNQNNSRNWIQELAPLNFINVVETPEEESKEQTFNLVILSAFNITHHCSRRFEFVKVLKRANKRRGLSKQLSFIWCPEEKESSWKTRTWSPSANFALSSQSDKDKGQQTFLGLKLLPGLEQSPDESFAQSQTAYFSAKIC